MVHGPASEAQTRTQEHRSRSAGACAKPRSLPPPRSGCGGRALRRVLSQARDEARAAKLAASGARPASAPCSRSGASACLATEMCRECSGAVVTWAQPRNEKRSGMDVPAQVIESGPIQPTSPALVREAHARGSGLALQHTLPSATAGRSERSAEDRPVVGEALRAGGRLDASASAKREFQVEPRRGEVVTPTARIENVRA